MRYKLRILFGEEQIDKMNNNEPFSEFERDCYIKVYTFQSKKEMKSFYLGIEEGVGWLECYFLDKNQYKEITSNLINSVES